MAETDAAAAWPALSIGPLILDGSLAVLSSAELLAAVKARGPVTQPSLFADALDRPTGASRQTEMISHGRKGDISHEFVSAVT